LNVDSGDRLIKTILPRLKQLFVNNKNDYSRALFYELMVFLYDQFEQLRNEVKSGLIRGLSDKSKVIRDKLISFWSDPTRLSLDAVERIKQVMNDLHVKEEESIWLNNAVFLLMQISTQSSDYERKIFDQPLQDCKFEPLNMNNYQNALANLQRSQPLTPLYSQQIMFQASQQAMAEMTKRDLAAIQELPDAEEGKGETDIDMIDTSSTIKQPAPLRGRIR
jgi:hypothetical protein